MADVLNFSDGKFTCYANVRLDSGEPCYINVAQTGVLVKKSRLGLLGPTLYKETVVYKAAMTAKALHHLYPDSRTPPGLHHPVLKAFTNAVLHCSSAMEVGTTLNQAIETAERVSGKPIGDLLTLAREPKEASRSVQPLPKEWLRTEPEGYKSDDLPGKPFTTALLARADSEVREAKSWLRDTLGSVRETKRADTLEGRVAEAIAMIAVTLTLKAADRSGVKPLLPDEVPTKHTSVVAAFGLILLSSLSAGVRREGVTFDQDAAVAAFFGPLYMLHSVERLTSLAGSGIKVYKELASVDVPAVHTWREQMTTLATCYVLQTSSSDPKFKDVDFDWLASEMLQTLLRAAE
jgi:hypothetical protein